MPAGALPLLCCNGQERAWEGRVIAQRSLVVNFIGDTASLEAAFKRAGAQSTVFANSVARSGAAWSSAGKHMQSFGRQMVPVSAGLAAIGGYAIKSAVDFQASTEKLRTQAGATQVAVEQLRKGMLNMASSVATTPEQLSAGMYHVVSSMNAVLPPTTRVRQELQILKVAAEGAQIGGSSLEDTSYALASAMNALHQNAGQAKMTMGQLNAIVGAGDMTMNDLLDAMKSGLIPTAKSFGVSLQSVGAALAVMGDMGMRGSLAGTRLRMALALLAAPSAKAAGLLQTVGLSAHDATAETQKMSDLLAKAGLNTDQLAADLKKPDGLSFALQDLNKHLQSSGVTAEGSAALISSAFGGGKMGAAIKLLDENTGRLNLKFAQIGRTGQQFGADWQATTQTTAFKWHQMVAALDADAIKLGTTLMPIAGAIAGDITHLVDAFTHLPAPVKKAVELLAALGAVLAPIALVMGTIARGIGGVTSLLGKLGGGGALAAGAGSGVAATAATDAAGAAAATGLLSKLRLGLATVLSRGLQGLAIGGIGSLMAQIIGGAIHGSVGSAIKSIGSDTAIGAGFGSIFGPAGIAGGALIGGLVGAVSHFVTDDAAKQGDEFAKKFTAQIPGHLTAAVQQAQKNLASAGTSAIPHLVPPGGNLAAQNAGLTRFELNPGQHLTAAASAFVSSKETQQLIAAAASWGKATGQAFSTGWKQVKMPTATIFEADAKQALNQVPAQVRKAGSVAVDAWRQSAAQQMIAYATSLEQNGKLPMKGLQQIIQSLEAQVPGLSNFLVQEGGVRTAQGLADAFRFTKASANLRAALASYRNQFGDTAVSLSITNRNIWQNAATAMDHLHQIVKTQTGQAKQDALANIKDLQQQSKTLLTRMATDAADKMAQAAAGIATNSGKARDQATSAFNQLVSNVASAMHEGLLKVNTGAMLIAQALNQQLKAFGAKPLPIASAIQWADWAANGAANTQQGGIGHRATGGMLVNKPMYMVGEEAPQHPEVVIATNPAYRKRNLGLWAHAGRALGMPGFATGGIPTGTPTLSYGQLEALWIAAGGPQNVANVAAAIAEAESGGRDVMQQGQPFATTGWGYWQITPGGPQFLDPMTNARMAVSDYNSRGFQPWTTFNDGAYRQFLQGNVPPGSLAGIGGAPQFGVPKVQGGGTIGTILQAAFKHLASAANTYLGKHQPQISFGGGMPGAQGPKGLGSFDGLQVADWIIPILNWARGHGWGGHITSGYRPEAGSEHAGTQWPGGAIDVGWNTSIAEGTALENVLNRYPGSPNLKWGGIYISGYTDPRGITAPGGHDYGHFSGTGRARGGFLANLPFAGSFDGGGMVPGPLGKPAMALVHGGEMVWPTFAGQDIFKGITGWGWTPTLAQKLRELEHTATKAGGEIAKLTKELKNASGAQKTALEDQLKAAKKEQAQANAKIGTTLGTLALIPSQGVRGQIHMTELQNQVALAQNAGDAGGQKKGLQAEMRLEQSWLKADQKRLHQVDKALRVRGLSKKQRAGLLQDKLALLQEIGTIEGDIGSTQTSLSDLAAAGDTTAGAAGTDTTLVDAIKQLDQTLQDQLHYMQQVGEIEKQQAIKALADIISGQIGGSYLSRSTGSAGVGTVARY